jgi:hypothetical protein
MPDEPESAEKVPRARTYIYRLKVESLRPMNDQVVESLNNQLFTMGLTFSNLSPEPNSQSPD